eukprot:5810452-Prymnesium_polylepis.1
MAASGGIADKLSLRGLKIRPAAMVESPGLPKPRDVTLREILYAPAAIPSAVDPTIHSPYSSQSRDMKTRSPSAQDPSHI